MATSRGNQPSKQDLQDLMDTVALLKDSFISLGDTIKQQLTNNITNANVAASAMNRTTIRDIERGFRDLGKGSDTLLDNIEKIASGTLKTKDITKQMQNMRTTQLRIESDISSALIAQLITQVEADKITNEMLIKIQEQTEELAKQLGIAKKQEAQAKAMKERIGAYGRVMQGLTKIPIVGQLIQANKVLEEMRKTAEEGGNKWKVLGVGIKETFKSIGDTLTDPAFLIGGMVTALTAIVKLVLDFENKSFEIAKTLGTSVTYADQLRTTFRDMAMSSKNVGLSSTELLATYAKLNDQFGFIAPQNREFAETATKLEKRIGATAEEMSRLATFGAISGKDLDKSYKTIIGYGKVAAARNKLDLTEKQILDGIAKVSDRVLINFKGNLPALTEAVVRAKKLGTTLDEMAKRGDNLLDFETSIAKQFEAEVLTGTELNLTRARELALAGKTGDLMEELTKQSKDFAWYSNQNAFGKQAFAEAVGTTTTELEKQYMLQQQADKLGAKRGQSAQERYNQLVKEGKLTDEIRTSLGETAIAELDRASAAEELNKTIENLKETLAYMLKDTIIPMVKQVIDWLKNSVNIQKVADGIKGAFTVIGKILNNLPAILATVAGLLTAMATISIANAVASVVGSTALIPGIGLIAAAAAGVGMYSYLKGLLSGGGGGAPSVVAPTASPAANTGGGGMTQPTSYTPAPVTAAGGSMTSGGGSGAANITVNLEVDGQKLASTVVQYLPQSAKASIDQNTTV